MDTLSKALTRAIADPGHFTARGDNYAEHLVDWQVRAVLLSLADFAGHHDGHDSECERCRARELLDAR